MNEQNEHIHSMYIASGRTVAHIRNNGPSLGNTVTPAVQWALSCLLFLSFTVRVLRCSQVLVSGLMLNTV